LFGGDGNDTLNGGADHDTALYLGNRSAYTIGFGASAVSGPEGSDTLTSIERLDFSDEKLAFDLAEPGLGRVTLLDRGHLFEARSKMRSDKLASRVGDFFGLGQVRLAIPLLAHLAEHLLLVLVQRADHQSEANHNEFGRGTGRSQGRNPAALAAAEKAGLCKVTRGGALGLVQCGRGIVSKKFEILSILALGFARAPLVVKENV